MINKADKKKIIDDFLLMQGFERLARDQYLKMAEDPFVWQAGIQNEFKLISQEEDNHARIVGTIIELIEKKL